MGEQDGERFLFLGRSHQQERVFTPPEEVAFYPQEFQEEFSVEERGVSCTQMVGNANIGQIVAFNTFNFEDIKDYDDDVPSPLSDCHDDIESSAESEAEEECMIKRAKVPKYVSKNETEADANQTDSVEVGVIGASQGVSEIDTGNEVQIIDEDEDANPAIASSSQSLTASASCDKSNGTEWSKEEVDYMKNKMQVNTTEKFGPNKTVTKLKHITFSVKL